MLKNKYLIALSGGPDSMFLLNEYSKNNNVVACFVNYNQREDSCVDEQIVSDFCKKNNIILYKLVLNKIDYQKGNFQDWARTKRFDFFKDIYDKECCDALLIAHHKDDFLESYYLQKNSSRLRITYGMKQKTFIYGMHVEKPLLFKYFKKQILEFNDKHNIPYAIDKSNFSDKYQRNIIRHKLDKKSFFTKQIIFSFVRFKNYLLRFKEKRIKVIFEKWQKISFEQNFFEKCKYKKYLVYKLINLKFEGINLSSKKIESIINFIISKNRTSSYKLKNDTYLIKKSGYLTF
ncbi:tRNA lysidine(34) synthetase TilS [Mycoplasma crocodyli]|uniref:tRNA(Ile)-lysidine synthase n=1 Tax=Mycoplasma crocodyli (strain ATCC 51981 / MP145) TaxID=512564 RepID=D5E6H8_MYCCM|nr:tRNA lysidine(34) synthetase TilS [Mycoplasma crocodyli]ADE19984.1 tRNA(Ile)-lysidine synthase [Mycoplasma crocodyli MP145]